MCKWVPTKTLRLQQTQDQLFRCISRSYLVTLLPIYINLWLHTVQALTKTVPNVCCGITIYTCTSKKLFKKLNICDSILFQYHTIQCWLHAVPIPYNIMPIIIQHQVLSQHGSFKWAILAECSQIVWDHLPNHLFCWTSQTSLKS